MKHRAVSLRQLSFLFVHADGRHRHCGAILQGTKGVTSSDHVMEIQFHYSDDNDNRTQDFRHATRLLKGVWLHFTPGRVIIIIIIIIITTTTTTKTFIVACTYF